MAFKKEIIEIIEPRDMFVGDIDAPVTLMEFGDYESEACAKANEVVKQLLVEYEGKIRFNFRHFPLTRIHQRSLKAGEAAVAGEAGRDPRDIRRAAEWFTDCGRAGQRDDGAGFVVRFAAVDRRGVAGAGHDVLRGSADGGGGARRYLADVDTLVHVRLLL